MRFSAWLGGLKVRFAAGVGLLLMLVGAPFFYLFYTLHRDRSIDSLKQATTDMSRVLVATIERPMFERQPHTLPDAVTRLVNPDLVQRVFVADKTGRVVVSSDPSLVGQRVVRESQSCRVCHERSPARREPATILTREPGVEVFRTMRPIFNRLECHRCHAPDEQLNGILMLDYSTAPMRARFRADIWRMLGLAVIMLPVTLVAIAVLMNWLVVGRVQALVAATQRVRRGNLDVTTPPSGDDELTVLGESFNAMTGTLRDSIHEIERQRSYLEHVIDSMEDQVCVVDSTLRIVTANRSLLAESGKSKEAVIGQPCADVAHGGGVPCAACPARAVFATGTVQKTHFVMPDHEGRERQYEVFCSPLRDGTGAVSQVIEVRRDVTERISLEMGLRHSERLASLGLLASGISHEINNPLASIVTCVDGLKRQIRNRSGETEEGRATLLEYLDLVSQETMRAKAITARLLVLSRPSSGLVSVVDLNHPILDTVSLLKFEAEHAGVILTPELHETLPPIVADEGQVRQLLLNLVLNAIQAAATGPRRPGRVSIRTSSSNGTLRLSVVDNGPGIDAGDMKKIFEPFYSRRPGEQGTGLGLFIAQTIVRGLQGTILVSSDPGEGAAFTVEIPVHDAQG